MNKINKELIHYEKLKCFHFNGRITTKIAFFHNKKNCKI